MLMHPGMRRLHAYGADELSGDQRQRTAAHIAGCAACRRTLLWFDAVRDAVRETPPEPSAGAWAMIAARVAAQDAVLLADEPATTDRMQRSAGRAVRVLRAAGLALLVAGGAAAAMPEAWLHGLLDTVVPGRGGALPAVAPALHPAGAAAGAVPPPVALIVEPTGGSVRVSLERPHADVRVHVRFVSGGELEVRALAGAAGATFRTSPGRIDILDAGHGAIMLTVPLSLNRVRIDVDGRSLLVREQGQLRILAPTADTAGYEFVLPVRPPGAPNNPR